MMSGSMVFGKVKVKQAMKYGTWQRSIQETIPFFHTHQIAKATLGSEQGIGMLENLVVGRHDPSGFEDFFDGAK
jgi:hypothetical protein